MNHLVVIGSVTTTDLLIRCLERHKFSIQGVLGYCPEDISRVSDWHDLQKTCDEYGLRYKNFTNINEDTYYEWVASLEPDIIFAVGFSQLLQDRWLKLPKFGCIGFHPTLLPDARGRAPVAWLVLEKGNGAASFFLMGEGSDDGPIFIQEPFCLEDGDDASSVHQKIRVAMATALDKWLPDLKQGFWNPIAQDEKNASWRGIRKPEDGRIEWALPAKNVDRLVKATCHPHPGAFTYYRHKKLVVWKSRIESSINIQGVPGRVLLVKGEQSLIQCGNGLIWIEETSPNILLRVGDKLGMDAENEIAAIWKYLGVTDES